MKSYTRLTHCILLLATAAPALLGQNPILERIVPRPVELGFTQQSFTFDEHTTVLYSLRTPENVPPGISDFVIRMRERLPVASAGAALNLANTTEELRGAWTIERDSTDTRLGLEGYRLNVHPTNIELKAATWAGVFRGMQTVLQLLPPEFDTSTVRRRWTIPCVSIVDTPRFSWRGMHLDVGRHMFPVSFIKKYIDLLALYKFNTFHWHLTEDQGWRIEIKKYPKLTSVGAWRGETMGDGTRYGGFYTQKEIREVVEYAAQRFITVVPEIEMPGHSVAALAAYPELACTRGPFAVSTRWGVEDDVLCAGNDKVFTFLENVLSEVLALFPSKFIHIGGDECPKVRWKACAKCQARMKQHGLATEHELQSWFIQRVEKFLNSKGRRIIGWDEILEGGLAPNAAVMSWRGVAGGIEAAKAGHDVVMTPTSHCYFDYAQGRSGEPTKAGGYIPADTVYMFEPVPAALTPDEARHVLGAQGNLWTEWIPDEKTAEYMVLPRLCALAEVLWSPKQGRSLESFHRRMAPQYARFVARGLNYRVPNPIGPEGRTVIFGDTVAEFRSPVPGADIRFTRDGSDVTAESERYQSPIPVSGSTTLSARLFMPDGRNSTPTQSWFYTVDRARNGVKYAYYEGSWTSLPDFSQLTPARTGHIYDLDKRLVPTRADEYGIRFSGSLDIPATGSYTFFLVSDDGSRFSIGDAALIDNDGLHGSRERSGTVRLAKGLHPFTLDYFESGGDERLELWMQAADLVDDSTPDAHGVHLGPASGKHPIDPSMLVDTTKFIDAPMPGVMGLPDSPKVLPKERRP
ncbi:MAG: family 20 glycosylhydrolase [Ignavibacteriae bacterium]|nr:family 20 glycosylhydrolase [Ignavibacteriota bacterium]